MPMATWRMEIKDDSKMSSSLVVVLPNTFYGETLWAIVSMIYRAGH